MCCGPPVRSVTHEDLTDEQLLGLIVEQQREALETFYRRYAGPVYSLAMQMLRDSGAAEEVTQDVFFNVWRRAASYKPGRGKVTSWLFSIGHHRAIDELRRRQRGKPPVDQDPETFDQPADAYSDPVSYTAVQFERARLEKALVTLRPEQREVVVLAYFKGLTHTEISKHLGHPLGTVKTRMRRALKRLREVLSTQARELEEHGL